MIAPDRTSTRLSYQGETVIMNNKLESKGERRSYRRLHITTLILLLVAPLIIISANDSTEPNAEAYYNRGLEKTKLGDYAAAVSNFDEAIRLDPDYAEAYYNRGRVKTSLSEYAGAIADFDAVIRLEPVFAIAYIEGRPAVEESSVLASDPVAERHNLHDIKGIAQALT